MDFDSPSMDFDSPPSKPSMDFTAFLATVSNELRIGDTEPTPARPETAALRRSIDAANERIERQRTQLKAAELRRIRAAALERARAAEQRGAATRLRASAH